MAFSEEIDALYGLPLDAFTAARNDLARRLRGDGRKDEAAEIAALRKPSLPAWTVNQLVREHRKEIEALLEAAAAIRGGAAEADAGFREALDDLLRAARALLDASGRKAPDALLRDVATTLRACAAVAPDELVAGRLTEAREASGFADALAGSAAPRRRPDGSSRAVREQRPAVDRDRVDAVAAAQEELRKRKRAATAAAREAEHARQALERAERGVGEARAELDEARAPGRER